MQIEASIANLVLTTSTILFPDEIIYHILHFLTPHEVVRLRSVSRQFNDVTRDARLWRSFYTNSPLPRPSGPFLWQSTQFLERILVHSARVSQTWTSRPISIVSRVLGPRISLKPSPISTSSDFLYGRLFIWCEREQLFSQDVETGIGRLVWEGTEPISSLDACSLTLPDSERVFIALRYVDEPLAQRTPMHLLEFPLQDDVRLMLGPVTYEMDLPEYANFPLSASAPFLYFHGDVDRIFGQTCEPMVMDARTRAVYKFPLFSSGLDLRGPRPWFPGFTLLSGEYIVVFHPWRRWDPPMTLIQTFTVPDPLDDTEHLRLTHEVVIEQAYAPTRPLRGAIVDPITGETNLRFLSADSHHGETRYLCVDIAIPPPHLKSTKVLSMVVSTQELFVLPGNRGVVFLDASNDGHGRGIVTLSTPEPPEVGDNPFSLYKFSVDASAQYCTAAVSEPSEITPQDVFHYANCYVFDGIRGRICHDGKANCNFYDLVVLGIH